MSDRAPPGQGPSDAEFQPESEREFDYDRTVFFSDAVFAIAITLLVLNVNLPSPEPGSRLDLWHLLYETRESLYSYALSFAVIGLMWVRQHRFFRAIARVDMRLTVLNLTFLACIAFFPFPTKVLALYGDQTAAPVLYASTVLVLIMISALERTHALKAGLARSSSELAPLSRYLVSGGAFFVSIPIAFFSPTVAVLCWLMSFVPGIVRRYKRHST